MEHGTLWVDYCGAMMIDGRKATGVDANRVLLGHLSAPKTAPGKVHGVPVWVFAKRGG